MFVGMNEEMVNYSATYHAHVICLVHRPSLLIGHIRRNPNAQRSKIHTLKANIIFTLHISKQETAPRMFLILKLAGLLTWRYWQPGGFLASDFELMLRVLPD